MLHNGDLGLIPADAAGPGRCLEARGVEDPGSNPEKLSGEAAVSCSCDICCLCFTFSHIFLYGNPAQGCPPIPGCRSWDRYLAMGGSRFPGYVSGGALAASG